MRRYHFHIILSSFLFGVALQILFPVSLPAITWMFLVVGGLALLGVKEQQLVSRNFFLVVFCATAFLVGLLRTEIASWSFGVSELTLHVGEEVVLEGVVSKEPDVRTKTQQLVIETEEDTVLVFADRFLDVSYGDKVTVKGELTIPESFTTELGREFHYDSYLLAKGIEYTVSFADVSVLERGEGNFIIRSLLKFKHVLLDGIETTLGEPQAGLGAGLLLGVKQALGAELESDFRKSGIIHIVVLSGYNIMLVVAFVMYVLSFMLKRRMRIFVGIGAVVAFALLVGLSATVVRASVMAVLLLVAQALGRTYDVTRSLVFAGAVMVFLNPYLLLYDIGFQFSFMATLGLVLLVPRFEAMLAEHATIITVREYLFATVATQIAVLPLLLYHIGEVSLVAVVVNLLVLPVVPIAMLGTFLAGMIATVSPLVAVPFAFTAHLSLSYIIIVATWFASLPFSAVSVPVFDAPFVFVLYAVFLACYVYVARTSSPGSMLDGWVIEEEVGVKEKVGGSLREPPTTPVFFR